MAGAPPSSSADFTPSWLKFTSTKQVDGAPAKDHLYKHAISCNKSSLKCSSIVELDSFYSKKTSSYSSNDKNKAWPLVGSESNKQIEKSNEKLQWSSTSDIHKLSFSAVCMNQNGTYAKRLQAPPEKQYSMDVDFPTLVSKESPTKPASPFKQANNMWNKPLVLKPFDNVQGNSTAKPSSNAKSNNDTNSIYKSLVPKSSPSGVKQPYRRITTFSVNSGLYKPTPTFEVSKDVCKKQATATPSVQPRSALPSAKPSIEDKQMVPTDKRYRKGKNVLKDFCQSASLQPSFVPPNETQTESLAFKENLHQSVEVKDQGVLEEEAELHESPAEMSQKDWWEEINTDLYQISPDADTRENPPLSSSLEAEHRLLRQMGWTEYGEGADGDATGSDESPLTEAEIREFFLNNKKRGLLSVPSPSHRETAFRDALSAWILSGPPVMRRNLQGKDKKFLNDSSSSSCSVSSDFSHLSSCGMDSD